MRWLLAFLLLPCLAYGQITLEPRDRLIEVGKGIRISPAPLDLDALAYFARAGVTDPTAKRQISAFISFLKSRGYWSSVVEIWLMRASQNAGTGTTVHGLKGAYNATLVNGPTWEALGITFSSASSQHALSSVSALPVGDSPRTMIAVCRPSLSISADGDIFSYGAATADGLSAINYNLGNGFRSTIGADATETGVDRKGAFAMATAKFSVGLVNSIQVNSNSSITASGAGENTTLTNLYFAIRSTGGDQFDGALSFAAISSQHLSDSQVAEIYAAYKQHLGGGLGLP